MFTNHISSRARQRPFKTVQRDFVSDASSHFVFRFPDMFSVLGVIAIENRFLAGVFEVGLLVCSTSTSDPRRQILD